MKQIEGNIVDIYQRRIFKGRVIYDAHIRYIEEDTSVTSEQFILPGLIDSHVHIESSMLSPLEYSKLATQHGVIAAVTDPHEIANVCGISGIDFMIENAKLTPMKIFFGAPSCVPATTFETSGAKISAKEIEELFASKKCFHLSEMMNYPGVVDDDSSVKEILKTAKKYYKVVDGHAPLLEGEDLVKYVQAGISTDHECTNVDEAIEKINLGMKIMLRNSSASKDFDKLISLFKDYSEHLMLCTDDCHPDELLEGYIDNLVRKAIAHGYDLFDIYLAAFLNAKEHYQLNNVGALKVNDAADFIVVDSLSNFNVQATIIDGEIVFENSKSLITPVDKSFINNFLKNTVSEKDILFESASDSINVIEIIPDSLLTKKQVYFTGKGVFTGCIADDILKVVVVNRYKKAKPSVGFINGFGIKKGAFGSTVAHDSHNIIVVGTNDQDILKVITEIQKSEGGLVVADGDDVSKLALPIAGLMSFEDGKIVADKYEKLSTRVQKLGGVLKAPFMTLAFMSLLVIPDLKIGDRGLFDSRNFKFLKVDETNA